MKQEQIDFWLDGAMRDWNTAKKLANTEHRDWALFIAQLALEKILKGLIIARQDTQPPMTHNLAKLAQLASIELTEEQVKQLSRIGMFNMEARYAETKFELYKRATQSFTAEWMEIIEEYWQWFKKLY